MPAAPSCGQLCGADGAYQLCDVEVDAMMRHESLSRYLGFPCCPECAKGDVIEEETVEEKCRCFMCEAESAFNPDVEPTVVEMSMGDLIKERARGLWPPFKRDKR